MVNLKRFACLGLGVLASLCFSSDVDAGLFKSKKKSSGFFGKKVFDGYVSKNTDGVSFFEPNTNVEVSLNEAWFLNLPTDIEGPVWLGTTYREVPYTEVEFNKLRDEKIDKEVERLKKDHVKKAKAAQSKEGAAAVDDLLNDLLFEGEEEKEEDISKYLENFDEEAIRRKVASRTFVAQTRYVPIPAIYLTLKNQQIFCIDLKTGVTSWVYRLVRPLAEEPFETEENLYVVQAGSCYIIDKQSGQATEKVNFDRAVYPAIYAQSDRLFPVGYGNRVAAWSPNRRTAHWYHKLNGGVNGGVFGHSEGLLLPLSNGELKSLSFQGDEKWTFVSKSHSDEKIYLEKIIADLNKEIENEKKEASREDRDSDLEVLNRIEKEIEAVEMKVDNLKHRSRGMYIAKPHIYGDSLVIGSTDFNLYRLNRFSGLPEWAYSCGASVKEEALVSDNWVYVKDDRYRLHQVGFDGGAGKIIADGVVRLLGANGKVACYEKEGRVWLDWGSSKGYLKGWAADQIRVSKDMSMIIGVDPKGTVKVWSTSGIRQIPQG